jgi:hypothetical protein
MQWWKCGQPVVGKHNCHGAALGVGGVHSSEETVNARGAKGGQEGGSVKDGRSERKPAPVPATAKPVGEARARFARANRASGRIAC